MADRKRCSQAPEANGSRQSFGQPLCFAAAAGLHDSASASPPLFCRPLPRATALDSTSAATTHLPHSARRLKAGQTLKPETEGHRFCVVDVRQDWQTPFETVRLAVRAVHSASEPPKRRNGPGAAGGHACKGRGKRSHTRNQK